MQRLRIRFSTVLVVVFLSTVLVAVIVALASMRLQPETPEAVARIWFDAFVRSEGKTLLEHTCAEKHTEVREAGATLAVAKWFGRQMLSMLEQLNLGAGVDMNLANVERISLEEDRAVLLANLEVTTSILGMHFPVPVEQVWIMKQEEGRWKWCGMMEQAQ